jgi:hypothetical protein
MRIECNLETGEIIELPDAPVSNISISVIIPTITMRQARMMLLNEGLLDEVNLAITTDEQKIWWDYSTTVERNHPLVDAVLIALGKTSAEIDTMFIGASQL